MPEVSNVKQETNEEKLHDSVSELFETERTYVTRLMTTYKVAIFINLLKFTLKIIQIYVVEAQEFLNENDRNQIFSNLDEILIANDNFFTDLKLNCDVLTGKGIGETFIKHVTS